MVVSGNHDSCGGEHHWIDLVTDKDDQNGIHLIDHQTVMVKGSMIHGLPWMPKANFLAAVPSIPSCDILVGHQAVQEYCGFPDNTALTIAELPMDKCQAFLLGHIHQNDFKQVEGKWLGYPGSTELYSQKEPDQKSFKMLAFRDGRIQHVEDIEIKTRPVERINIKTESELENFIEAVRARYGAGVRHPIIYASYPAGGLDVRARLRAALDPDSYVLRPQTYLNEQKANTAKAGGKLLEPMEFLRSVMKPDAEISALLTELLDKNVHADDALNRFVDKALQTQI